MPNTEWKRKLDLSAAKAKPAKAKQDGPLTDRQVREHQKAIQDRARWTSRLKRAANEVARFDKKVRYYERLISKQSASE